MRTMIAIRTVMGAALALGLAGTSHAQIAAGSSAPIDITADEAEVINSRCVAIWRGDAEALQGRTRLRARTISVYSAIQSAGGCGSTDRIEAEGSVYYVTAERSARADRAVYDARADAITLTGDVIVVQGKNVARGDSLTVSMKDGQAQMASNAKGRGKAGRVRGVFYPSNNGQPGGAP